MPSRWGHEALVLRQFLHNAYDERFLDADCAARQNAYLVDILLPELRGLADIPFLDDGAPDRPARKARALRVLANELPRLAREAGLDRPAAVVSLAPADYSRKIQEEIKSFIDQAEAVLTARRRRALDDLEARRAQLRQSLGRQGLEELQLRHHNREMARLAYNLGGLETVRLSGDRLVQLAVPVCQQPESTWGRAHFMSAQKRLGPWWLPTPAFNLGVLWLMVLALYLALWFSLMPRLMAGLDALTAGFVRWRARGRIGANGAAKAP